MDVNYKNNKRYKTAKYPIRQPILIVWLIWLLSKIMLIGKKYKVEKINMEGLKPPYMLLSNHMYFIDFELCAMGTLPHRVNNVVSIDGYYRRPWLMELIGAICTRKYTRDLHLIKSINKVLKRGDVMSMYPEARYSPCGVLSFMPDSLGKLIKLNKVPVVAVVHHGNHLHSPFWNFRKKRKVPLHTTMTQILTAEQVKSMSVDEINEAVKQGLYYDDYKYAYENGIKITEPYRAEGLHKVLYQCPNCKKEHVMDSKGTEIFCTECGKRWNFNEDCTLSAINGETEFSHIPDWFLWEKENVKNEVRSGNYSFFDEVEVFSMPRTWKFEKLGMATITHDKDNGFILKGHYNGKDYEIKRAPIENNSLHIEYDYCYLYPLDCFDISTENDSFYCYPKNARNVVTKLAFATEEIYNMAMEKTLVKK